VSRPPLLDDDAIEQFLQGHTTWHLESGHLVRVLSTKDYIGAAALFQAQVPLAQRLNHHPTVTVDYNELRVEIWTHDQGGISALDLDYVKGFDELLDGYASVLS
jgi:4a-hydroxytetrahydrobiopterin dehydratase